MDNQSNSMYARMETEIVPHSEMTRRRNELRRVILESLKEHPIFTRFSSEGQLKLASTLADSQLGINYITYDN